MSLTSFHGYVISQGCLHFAENETYQNRIKHIPIDSLQTCKACGDGDACAERSWQLRLLVIDFLAKLSKNEASDQLAFPLIGLQQAK